MILFLYGIQVTPTTKRAIVEAHQSGIHSAALQNSISVPNGRTIMRRLVSRVWITRVGGGAFFSMVGIVLIYRSVSY